MSYEGPEDITKGCGPQEDLVLFSHGGPAGQRLWGGPMALVTVAAGST